MYVNVDAIVLAAEKTAENDKRLTLFTRERGRLYARAVGAVRGRLAAASEVGVRAAFRLWLPEGGVSARVTGGGVTAVFPGLRRDWRRMTSAQFLCEWTDRLTPLAHPAPEKMDLLAASFAALEKYPPPAVRLAFLAQFLRLAGYGPAEAADPEAVRAFLAWDFAALPPEISDARAFFLEEQLVKSMAPLLPRPLKSLAHQRALAGFLRKSRTP